MDNKFKLMPNIQFVFNGGLGNQIFQYLASRQISRKFKNVNLNYSLSRYIRNGSRTFDLNHLLIKPISIINENNFFNDENISKLVEHFPLFNKNQKSKIKFKLNILYNLYFEEKENISFNDPLLKLMKDLNSLKHKKGNLKIHGFWQNPSSYLIDLKNNMDFLIDTKELIPKGIESNKYITIHARREDYISRKDIIDFYFSKFSPIEYILLSLQLIPSEYQNYPIFLLSDDKYWSKKITTIISNSLNKKISSINSNNHFEDWSILRHASINICSNSTFSYSAALLNNENKDSKIRCIVPQWINKDETAYEKGWLVPNGFIEI